MRALFRLIKSFFPWMIMLMVVQAAGAMELSSHEVILIRNAIWLAEGGNKAVYCYGIKSVHYKSKEEARIICENSIRNNFVRWQSAKTAGAFIPFMAARYCPLDQSNWSRNVTFYCLHPKKIQP